MDSLPARFRKEVFDPYLDLLRAEFRIHRNFDFIREIWERDLSMERLANGPFLERAQLYMPGENPATLGLHDRCASRDRGKAARARSLQTSERRVATRHSEAAERCSRHRHEQWQDALLSTSNPRCALT